MEFNVSEWLNLIFRWTHVVAGIIWIGHLYFFNFVNAQVAKTYDADSKKKVVPELMPRALYWFRWGAMYTWISGILLLEIVYYAGGAMGGSLGHGPNAGIGILFVLAAFFVYDLLWKTPVAKNEMVGTGVSWVLFAAIAWGLGHIWGGRAVWIHMGGMLGTIMFLNVWMRIWPAQRKIIAGIKGTGAAPDASVAALAGLRSKHNTYMSVPLVLIMVSNHFPGVFAAEKGWAILSVLVLVGWGVTKLLYGKAGQPAPLKIGDAAPAAPKTA